MRTPGRTSTEEGAALGTYSRCGDPARSSRSPRLTPSAGLPSVQTVRVTGPSPACPMAKRGASPGQGSTGEGRPHLARPSPACSRRCPLSGCLPAGHGSGASAAGQTRRDPRRRGQLPPVGANFSRSHGVGPVPGAQPAEGVSRRPLPPGSGLGHVHLVWPTVFVGPRGPRLPAGGCARTPTAATVCPGGRRLPGREEGWVLRGLKVPEPRPQAPPQGACLARGRSGPGLGPSTSPGASLSLSCSLHPQ